MISNFQERDLRTLKKGILALAVTVLFAIPASAQSVSIESIEPSVEQHTPQPTAINGFLISHVNAAKAADPNYLAAVAARDAAEEALNGAEAQLGPKIILSMSIFKTDRIEETSNSIGQRSDVERRFESQLNQLQARQPLYHRRESLGVDQAVAQVEGARRTLLATEQDLYLRVVLAWVDVLTARANHAALVEALKAAQETLEEMERRFKAGDSTVQEVDQASAKLIEAQALIEDALAQQEIADQALRNIVGPTATVPVNLSMMAFKPFGNRIDVQSELTELVDRQNQEIAAARFQEEASRLEREKARADHYPTVDAIASASQGRSDTLSSIKNEQRVGVQLSVPLYTHGAITAAVQQADANFRRSQAQSQATTLRVRADALTAAGNLRAIQSKVAATDRLYQATLLMLKSQKVGLKAGISSRADVARTISDLLTVARQRVSVRKEQAAAWAKYTSSTGGFNEQVLESIQKILQSKGKDFEGY